MNVNSYQVNSALVAKKLFNITLTSLRCCNCNKLLAKYNTKGLNVLEIKCPRCRTINEV
jgi:hypothetical protein